ncbi:ABC transporter substrate-binding protein [Bifidobacterium biavatii]|nr:extracellular solute-binding protein [Bifidobacterium biavatii]
MRKPITKRARMIIAAAGAFVMSLSLAGCQIGGSTTGAVEKKAASDTITMMNYPDWMGSKEVDSFKEKTGYTIKQVSTPDGGDSAWVNIIRQNQGSYDMSLAGMKVAETLKTAGLLEDFDASKVKNLSNIDEKYVKAFPWGIPVEQGKIGIIYNKDEVKDPPTSWKDLFARAKEFSGKLLMPSYSSDVIDVALLATGHDLNTKNTADIDEAKQAVLGIKQYVKAFVDSDAASQVYDGSTSIAVVYDYDYASAKANGDKVGWVSPSEGMPGYIDGWVPLKGTANLNKVYQFMDFHLDKSNYADFINTTQASWLMPSVTDSLDKNLVDNEALNPETAGKTIYGTLQSADIQQAVASAWQEIQNS